MIQGRLLRGLFALLASTTLSAKAETFLAVPGEYVVKLRSAMFINSAASLSHSLGAKIVERVSPQHGLILIQRPVVETQASVIQTLSQNPMIEYIEPNYIYRVVGGATSMPNDSELTKLWGMSNTGQKVSGDGGSFTGKVGVDIDAERAWRIETGSRNVVVAVIDTGVVYSNPDLAPNIYSNTLEANGQAGIDDDANGCIDDVHGCDFPGNDGDPMDVYGHGTHVAGTIGAMGNDGLDIVGVAWNVTILPVRFLGDNGSGTLVDAVKSIDYATSMKVDIMNNSWGGGGFSQALLESIQRARDAGILFLAAAGNSTNDNDARPVYPASYEVDNVLAVAAIDPAGNLAGFSNYGKNTVGIAAPGVNILSHTVRKLESWSGTSMACPHVAGVAALLLSQDETQSYMTIKNRMLASARPIAGIRNKVSTGMVNAYYALTNQVAPPDQDDPFNWQQEAASASTLHPYANGATEQFTFHVPGAKRIALKFSKVETQTRMDKVSFRNANGEEVAMMSGRYGEGYGPAVDGDTVTVVLIADDRVNRYGFDVIGLAYQ